jgi:hypothetical protein
MEDGPVLDGVASGLACLAPADRPEAERRTAVRAAVSQGVQPAALRIADDSELAPSDPCQDPPLALDVSEGADLVPGLHAGTRPSRAP